MDQRIGGNRCLPGIRKPKRCPRIGRRLDVLDERESRAPGNLHICVLGKLQFGTLRDIHSNTARADRSDPVKQTDAGSFRDRRLNGSAKFNIHSIGQRDLTCGIFCICCLQPTSPLA